MSEKIRNLDQVMDYLENHHHINMSDTTDRIYLQNFGYYHGYKGYRYIKTPENRIDFSDFNQVIALNNFDLSIKGLFYPHIMFLETALKSYVLEVVVEVGQSSSFSKIYETVLTDYKTHPVDSSKYKSALDKRLEVRSRFFNTISRGYPKKQLISHFYHKDLHLPIWALFELITLGEFGHFTACIDPKVKIQIGELMKLNPDYNKKGKLLENAIEILQDLRNSVAHNEVIFDTRFRVKKSDRSLIESIEADTGITEIHFNYIVDYLVLIGYFLKRLHVDSKIIHKMIDDFILQSEAIKQILPDSIYKQIVHSDTPVKLSNLKKFIMNENQ
jgi:abortive infection bacteriophage resistance protein